MAAPSQHAGEGDRQRRPRSMQLPELPDSGAAQRVRQLKAGARRRAGGQSEQGMRTAALDLCLGEAQSAAALKWGEKTERRHQGGTGRSEEEVPVLEELMCFVHNGERYVAYRREGDQLRPLDPTEVLNICNEDIQAGEGIEDTQERC